VHVSKGSGAAAILDGEIDVSASIEPLLEAAGIPYARADLAYYALCRMKTEDYSRFREVILEPLHRMGVYSKSGLQSGVA
jgi:hypothetical protein